MDDNKIAAYANVMVWAMKKARKRNFKKGDVVRVAYELPGLRLAEAIFKKLVQAGYNPVARALDSSMMEKSFYMHAASSQLEFVPKGTKEFNESLSGSIFIAAPESLTHLSAVNPKAISKAMVARKPYRDILWRREEQGAFGWTLCLMPTVALANSAGLTIEQYENEIIKACFLDKPSPVGSWESIYKKSSAVKEWLNALDILKLNVKSDSCDLTISLGDKRRWLGCSGHNIPSFEIFTSPDWRGTDGVYFANLPSYRSGNYIESVRMEFKKGVLVSSSAKKGDKFVKEMLASDKAAGKIGEFSLTDKRFSRIGKFMAETLYDENFGGVNGNCHIAVGSAYTDAYSGNISKLTSALKQSLGFNDSSLHWDLVNTEKKVVTASLRKGGELVIYKDGKFLYSAIQTVVYGSRGN